MGDYDSTRFSTDYRTMDRLIAEKERLRAWVSETAPTLTVEQWRHARAVALRVEGDLPNDWMLSYAEAQALLAHVREIAEGLTGNGSRYLAAVGKAGAAWDDTCAFCGWQECAALGLVARTSGIAGCTPLGREVARELGGQP